LSAACAVLAHSAINAAAATALFQVLAVIVCLLVFCMFIDCGRMDAKK
jgi:hypothetical protein